MAKTSFDKRSLSIVLLEGVHESAVQCFARHGYTNVARHAKALAGAELASALAGAHFVGIRSRTRLSAEVRRSPSSDHCSFL